MRSAEEMRGLQRLPLDIKVAMTMDRIREWVDTYGDDGVCISFSGGKDSTVLLHLVRSYAPNVKAVFSDTGLEYPEIRNFVKTFDNVDWIKPKMTFGEIVGQYGYPLFSKEISNTIWYARKLRGGGAFTTSAEQLRDSVCDRARDETMDEGRTMPGTSGQTNCRRKKIQGALQGKGRKRDKSRTEVRYSTTYKTPFFNGQEDGDKSIFNKEKYLPACRELPFLISSNCCGIMKKRPMAAYQRETGRKPFIGTLAEESMLRLQGWIKTGCNAFDSDHPISKPLSFWTEQDILEYIKSNGLEIAPVYGDIVAVDEQGNEYDNTLLPCGKLKCTGASRTGCMYCAYGAGNEHKRLGKSRFERLAETHPKVYDYVMRGGEWADNPYYDPTAPKIDPVDGWENWNPKKIWVPSKDGLGMRFVFEKVNEIYNDYIRF